MLKQYEIITYDPIRGGKALETLLAEKVQPYQRVAAVIETVRPMLIILEARD